MAPKQLLDRITFRRKATIPASHLSVLDLPLHEYDKATQLPFSIQVGGRSVRPFVGVQEVRDHLTLLSAFHALSTRPGHSLQRLTDSAAFDYERWASTVLPVRARRKRSASSETLSPGLTLPTPSSAPMSRTGTWSPPESPLSEVSSAASSTVPSPPSHSLFLPLAAHELPPLPVLMCWHAHLLNPAQFALDADGTYAWLHAIPFPLELAAEAVRKNTLPKEIQHVHLYGNDLRPVPSISGWTPLDMSAAVQRLARRIATLNELRWLDDSYITGDVAPIQTAIVRYHAWLDLMSAIDRHPFLAPTFDVMLAWATHQLHGARYLSDTERVLGTGHAVDRAVDRAEQDPESLKRAGNLWKARYKHEYVQRRAPLRRSTV